MNISSTPQDTADDINNWVKNITNNKITQLADTNAIKGSVVMLLNAIYFKGLWKHPFNNTVEMEFYTGNSEIARKEFVQQVNTFNYAYDPDQNLRIIQLPYEGKKFSMYIILPFDNEGLDQVIRNLSSTGFDEIFKDMESTNVNVTLPKFRFDSNVNLNNVVKEVKNFHLEIFNQKLTSIFLQLGVTEIFTDAAEFPQFRSKQIFVFIQDSWNYLGNSTADGFTSKIKVSSIIQKSGIVVDEKGSEAQAATGEKAFHLFTN